MDRKKRLILFRSVLGVLILIGLYVVAVEHLGSYTVTTTGEADNLVNWSKQSATESETFNFTIPFSSDLSDNVTQVWITINDVAGYFDFATNASNSSVLMNAFGGNAYEGANYSCKLANPVGSLRLHEFVCENTSALHEFIQGSTLYFEVNVTVNGSDVSGTTLSVDNATAIQFNISTFDVAKNWNETWLYMGIDQAAPIIYDINVTDGNRTLMNGTDYVNLSWNTALDGTDNNLSKSNIIVTVLVQDPNIKNMTLYYTGTDEELLANSALGNNTFGNGTAVAMTLSAVMHIGGDSGNLTDAGIINTHSIFTGTIPSTGLSEGNLTTFVLVAADHYSQERVENNTATGANDMFAFRVTDANAQVNFKRMNVSDYSDNVLHDGPGLDGNGDYLRAELNQFQVEIKNVGTTYGGDRNVTLYYNTSATITIDSNGTVSGYLTSIQLANVTETIYNGSVNFAGNDTNTIQFAVELMDSTSGYSSILGPYSYAVDGANPSEPSLTVPSDTTKDVSDSTGITYSCSSSDVTSGGITYGWTLTKPGGETVTKTGSSATFSNTDINKAGTYSIRCVATDAVGYTAEHVSTSTEDFLVTYSSSGTTSSGGGGGGGGSGSSASFDVDFTKNTQGTLSIAQGSSRTFTFDGSTTHTVKITGVEGQTATISLTSEPITLTLNVGESKKVDLNGDSVSDVKVTLNSIKNSVADLTIEKLEEGAKIVQQQEVDKRAAEEAGEQPVEAEEITPEEITKIPGLGIWITIVILVVIAVVAYFTIKKKK